MNYSAKGCVTPSICEATEILNHLPFGETIGSLIRTPACCSGNVCNRIPAELLPLLPPVNASFTTTVPPPTTIAPLTSTTNSPTSVTTSTTITGTITSGTAMEQQVQLLQLLRHKPTTEKNNFERINIILLFMMILSLHKDKFMNLDCLANRYLVNTIILYLIFPLIAAEALKCLRCIDQQCTSKAAVTCDPGTMCITASINGIFPIYKNITVKST